MQHLKITNLYFKYNNSSSFIFQNLNLEFDRIWSCIVGSNGSGKSTLLKLISKELKPQQGFIKGNDLVYYCTQSTEFLPQNFEEFIYTYNKKAFKIKELLGINDSWLYSWDTLSHGERKRAQIAVALFLEPDVLLLDEPTNHLDIKNKKIVFNALISFKGIGLLVSHDRKLLDELCTNTLFLKDGDISLFKTNYSNAMVEYEKDMQFLYKQQENQNKQLKKLKQTIQSQKQKVSLSNKRFSKKDIDKNDNDTKNKINLAKLTGKDKNDGQVLKTLQSKQNHLNSKVIKTHKVYSLGISIDSKNSNNIFPLDIKSNTLKLSDDKNLFFQNLSINQNDKIGIVGENGSGKSSFINYLLSITNFKNEILYIPQEISEQQSKDFFKDINTLPKDKKGEIYTIVTKLASNSKVLLQSSNPSAGEIRKLFIAKGLLENPLIIILDEPTNHMDLDSILALEEALKKYDTVVIIISHDTVFLDNIVDTVWKFNKKSDSLYTIDI